MLKIIIFAILEQIPFFCRYMSLSPQRQLVPNQQHSDTSFIESQTQIQKKQQFLREQILQKNYNAEDFVQYLNEKMNVQSDIDKCSFDELNKVVRSYIAKVKKDEIHMSQFGQKGQSEMKSSIFQSINSLPPVVMVQLVHFIQCKNSQPLIIQQQFTQIVKCCKIQQKYNTSELKSKKVQCSVHSHRPQRKFVTSILGINTSSYLQFKVKTHGFGWQVGRRYSDFIWLRSTLKKFYPSQILPPIPNKKAQKRSPRQLQKRMSILSFFLNDLLSYPQFINSRYIQGFLSYPQAKFIQFKKQIDNKKSFQSITTTETLSGQVQISLNKQIVVYNKQLQEWISKSQTMLKDLTRNSKNLQRGIIDQVNTLYDMGDQLAGLHQGTQKISKIDDRPTNGLFKLKEIFVGLNNMVIEWGSVLRNQIDIISSNCNIVFKYVRESLSGFRQLTTQMKQHESQYFQAKIQLDAQKQKLFALHDFQKWDIPKSQLAYIPKSALYQKKQAFKIMLPKRSACLQKLKMTYCYYLSRIYHNSDLCLSRKATLICSSMQQFTIKQKVLNQQVGQTWSEMAYIFSHAFQEKGNKNKRLWVKTQEKIKKDETDLQNNDYESQSALSFKKN